MTFNTLSQSPGSSKPRGRVDPRPESPGQLALIGLVVWLVGAVIHPFAILAPLGLVLLLLAGVAYVLRPRTQTMYWRGRRIDLDNGSSLRHQLYRLFFKG